MNLIKPQIFSGSETITAVFTEANRFSDTLKNEPSGIDFGMNTSTESSIIETNYRNLFDDLNLKNNSIALANQIHESNIEIVESPGVYKETDGLITKTSGLSLGIQVADCAAVLIADDGNQVIGAFHAGWRGAVADIIPKGIKKMEGLGAQISALKAYVSPCISEEMFEVGEEVAVQFPDMFVDRTSYKKPHVDLKGFITYQMVEAGLNRNQIEISSGCSMKDTRYFSYRREREKAGRMLGLIHLK